MWSFRIYEYNYTLPFTTSNRSFDCFNAICNITEVTNNIIHSLVTKSNNTYVCENNTWSTYNGTLQINNQDYPCFDVSNKNDAVLPLGHRDSCHIAKYPIIKYVTTTLGVKFKLSTNLGAPIIHQTLITESNITSISISVNVTFSSNGGIVCGGAFPVIGNELTYHQVMMLGYCVSQEPTNHSITRVVKLRVKELIASTTYSVIVVGEDTFGNPSNFQSSLDMIETTTTSCCDLIKFDPSYIIGFPSVEIYSGISQQLLTQYTVNYHLSTTPKGHIRVSLSFSSNSTNQTYNIFSIPSYFEYNENSVNLDGSFVVYGTPGYYQVRFDFFGQNASLYQSSTGELLILSNISDVPAPKLLSASLTPSGRIIISFDSPTNMALTSTSSELWRCDSLVEFPGSKDSNCLWEDSKTLIIILPSSIYNFSSQLLSEKIFLRSGVLLPQCLSEYCIPNYSTLSSVTLTEEFTADEVIPQISLNIPKTYSFYGFNSTGLLIDVSLSYGSGGFNWKTIQWIVQSNGTRNFKIEEYLSKQSLSSPIILPPEYLTTSDYTFTLGLSNTFQTQDEIYYKSVKVSIDKNRVDVSINIIGPSSVVLAQNKPLRLETYLTLSGLLSNKSSNLQLITSILYKWKVYLNYVYIDTIVSESVNPGVFFTNSLEDNSNYYIEVITEATIFGTIYHSTAGVSIFTESSPVSYISGGATALSTISEVPLTLISSCESHCQSSWSCVIRSPISDYGQSCDSIIGSNEDRESPTITIPPNSLIGGYVYEIKLTTKNLITGQVISSPSSSSSILIETLTQSSPLTWFSSTISNLTTIIEELIDPLHIIHSRKFILTGTLNSRRLNGLNASWSLSSTSSLVLRDSKVSFTPINQHFSSTHIQNGVNYPIGLNSYTLGIGKQYTFRLSCYISSTELSYYEVTVRVNYPPSGGIFQITPDDGIGHITEYSFLTSLWLDDINDYPFSFEFVYQHGTIFVRENQYFPVGLLSLRSYISSILPSGQDYFNLYITCGVFVEDIWGSKSFASNIIRNLPPNSLDSSSFSSLSNIISTISSYEGAKVYSSSLELLRNAAITLQDNSMINCSNSPKCSDLNRENCKLTSHTCGPCLFGYSGIYGDSNYPCHVNTIRALDSSVICQFNSDCKYGFCSEGICKTPLKSCPKNSRSGLECSGNGVCLYLNLNNEVLHKNDCKVDEISCNPICNCSKEGYGHDCGLTIEDLQIQNQIRGDLCSELSNVLPFLEPSESKYLLLLDLMVQYQSIDYINSSRVCIETFVLLTNELLQNQNYHLNLPLFFDQQLLSTLSIYYDWKIFSLVSGNARQILRNIRSSVLGLMIPGQNSISLTSPNLRTEFHYDYLGNIYNSALVSPSSSEEEYYNKKSTSVILPSTGFDVCNSFESYAQYDTLVYASTNSFNIDDTISVTSPLFTFNSYSTRSIVAVDRTGDNLYNVIIPLYFDYLSNQSTPNCAEFNLFTNTVDLCGKCNITSFNKDNVTFTCFDASSYFCPSTGSSLSSSLTLASVSSLQESNEIERNHRRMQTAAGKVLFVWSVENTPQSLHSNSGLIITRSPKVLYGITGFLALIILCILMVLLWDMYDREVFIAHRSSIIQNNLATFDLTAAFDERGVGIGYGLDPFGKLKPTSNRSYNYTMNNMNMNKNKNKKLELTTLNKSISSSNSSQSPHATQEENDLEIYDNALSFSRGDSLEYQNDAIKSEGDVRITIKDYGSFDMNDNTSQNERPTTQRDHKDIFQVTPDQFAIRREKQEDIFIDMSPRHNKVEKIEGVVEDKENNESGDVSEIGGGNRKSKNNLTFQHHSHHNHQQKQNETIRDGSDNFAIKDDVFVDLGLNTGRIETFPPTSLLSDYPFFTRLWRALKRHHKWIRIFTYPSIRYTRLMRLFVATNDLLFIVFFNSLFYSIFYPDNNHCQDYSDTSEETCLHEQSKFEYSKPLCEWNEKSEVCSLRNPSDNIVFIVEVSMLIIIFSIVPRKLTQFLLEKFCSKRPVLESLGFSSSLFLRREPESLEKSSYVLLNNNNNNIGNKYNNNTLSLQKKLNLEVISDPYKKCNPPTPFEEVLLIQTFAQKYLVDESLQLESTEELSHDDNLLKSVLGLFKLNNINKLSNVDQSTLKKISKKISKIRNKSEWIKFQAVDSFEVGPSQLDYIDLVLLREYILEQIPPFPRFVIRQEIYEMDHCTPGRLNTTSWMLSWLVVLGIWGYLSYYSLNWSMTNGVGPSSAWGLVLLVVILSDVFVNDTFQILFYFVIVTDKIRPQLHHIYIVLRDIWEKKVLKGIQPEDDLRVIQHISSACRASRLDPLEIAISGRILRLLTDQDVALPRSQRIDSFWKLGLIATITLWIPMLLSGCYRIIQTTSLDLIFSIFWCCFILLNYVIVLVHPGLLAALYCFLLLIFIFVFYVAETEWYRQSIERLSSSMGVRVGEDVKGSTVNRESDQLFIEHNRPSKEVIDNVSPMFKERTSSFFRKQRRISDGIERKVTAQLATLQSGGGSGSSTPPLGVTNFTSPQLTHVSTIVSQSNVEQMFIRSSNHNFVSGTELFNLCDRVLSSFNVSIVGGPLNETELYTIFNFIPQYCIQSENNENNDEYQMDLDGFVMWLEYALEQIDITRQADKVMKKRLESQHQNMDTMGNLPPQIKEEKEEKEKKEEEEEKEERKKNQEQFQYSSQPINTLLSNKQQNSMTIQRYSQHNRDSIVSDLTMESVFLGNSSIIDDTSTS